MAQPSWKVHNIEKSAIKALVILLGPVEAARQTGINLNTIRSLARSNRWKKARPGPNMRDAGDMVKEAIEKSKETATLHLAKFTENAAVKAAESNDPLAVARRVRDVAGVYSTLWPNQEKAALIEGGILLGQMEVKDAEIIDEPVRQELPDRGHPGD
jgi:hypothetical protein